VMTRLRDGMRQAMTDPEVLRVFENAGSPPAYQDAAEFARFVETDSARLIKAVQVIGKVE
jgi:tripartite-type tricarboxylate transporter receptor subunit TctC